MDSNTDNNST